MKKLGIRFAGMIWMSFCCVMMLGTVTFAAETQIAAAPPSYQVIGTCMVITNGTVLYDAPGGNGLYRVRAGSEIFVLTEDAQWVGILYGDRQVGYISAADVLLYDKGMTVQKQAGQLTREWLEGEAWVQYLAASLAGLSPAEQVTALNGYLCETIIYDINSYTTYDALVNKKARCQGYSNAFERIMDAAGVATDSVGGYVLGENGPVSHSWNRCLIDGQYYYVDVCWNDSAQRNDWLLISGEEMEQDHMALLIRDEVE